MAVLNAAQRKEVRQKLTRILSRSGETLNVTKAQFLAGIDASDTWFSDNTASHNSALPAAAKNNLTANQKKRMKAAVARKRFEEDI